jgi:hypothetical protein
MLQSAFVLATTSFKRKWLTVSVAGLFAVAAGVCFVGPARAQATTGDVKDRVKTKPTPVATPPKLDPKNLTAEQAAEIAIVAYGVRDRLNQVRKTTLETGSARYVNSDGKTEESKYQKYVMRGETLGKEKIRVDQEFSNARYSLLYSDGSVVGIYNNAAFTPRQDVSKGFENQIVHGIEALLRYKEDGSTVTLASRDKVMGVEYIILDVEDKQGRKTRFYVSARTYRVMMLTYEDGGVQYRRKFYDYNYAQGTLVPYRTVLWAGDKQVEETEIGTVTFGQKVDEGLFTIG